ncbi:MAG: hypothetical protein GXP32_04315 [Kiritimatiellaeota bacterium]|nr:hypothetical protein [Kiritimatiellota bacterium]
MSKPPFAKKLGKLTKPLAVLCAVLIAVPLIILLLRPEILHLVLPPTP